MAAAAAAPAVLSLASVGFSAAGSVMRGQGQNAADQYQAARMERAAEFGRVKADQTYGTMTEQLNRTLGEIQAVRAAAHTDPTSPTGVAIHDYDENLGNRQIRTQTANILEQAQQNEQDAAYLRDAGHYALMQGNIGAAGSIFKGLAGLAGGMSGGMGGGGGPPNLSFYAPDDL